MSAISNIQWTDRTWNPVRGCSRVSTGCEHCYAERQAHRFSGAGQPYEGLTRMTEHGPVWTGKIRLVPEALEEPLRWRKPSRVFVNSMSDIFHEDVPAEFISQVFAIMALAKEHTFQILTKRPERMRDYLLEIQDDDKDMQRWANAAPEKYPCAAGAIEARDWPLSNVWLGVSVENQASADERIPILLQTPAAVRFLSVESLLEAVDIAKSRGDEWRWRPGIDWVIIGGESGPNARPCNIEWIRSIVRQCKAAGVRCFVKQLGSAPVMSAADWNTTSPTPLLSASPRRFRYTDAGCLLSLRDPKAGNPAEWPEDLRVREFPR